MNNLKKSVAKRLAATGISLAGAIGGGYMIYPWEGDVKNSQGLHTAYKDPVGIVTFCQGLTGRDLYNRQVKLGMTYTDEECDQMMASRIKEFEQGVDYRVKVPYRSDWMKASLISFSYNVGLGAFGSSTLLKKLNARDYDGACLELTKWVYANKKKLPGLVSRRGDEYEWCMGNPSSEARNTYNELIDANFPFFKMGEEVK